MRCNNLPDTLRYNYFISRLFFLLLLVILPSTLLSQEIAADTSIEVVQKSRPRHFSVGVLGGLDRNYHITDMSYMNDYSYSKYAPGYSFGIQFGYTPVQWLTIRMDGVLTEKNSYRSHVITSYNTSFPDTTISGYFNLPLLLQLNVGRLVQLHAVGGGYVGYLLSRSRMGLTQGMNNIYYYSEPVDLDSPESVIRDNRFDAGIVYGAGLSAVIAKMFEIGVEVRWYYGLTDTQKDYMAHLNPHYNTTFVMQGGLSYKF